MQQNPFVRMQDGCTFNAGHVTANGVHIGPWHGDANSINITTHHAAPMWYGRPPQGIFYEGFMPPGAPGFGGGPRAQEAFYPSSQNGGQCGPYANGFGQTWTGMGNASPGQYSKGYGTQQTMPLASGAYGGYQSSTAKEGHVTRRDQRHTWVSPQTTGKVSHFAPQPVTGDTGWQPPANGAHTTPALLARALRGNCEITDHRSLVKYPNHATGPVQQDAGHSVAKGPTPPSNTVYSETHGDQRKTQITYNNTSEITPVAQIDLHSTPTAPFTCSPSQSTAAATIVPTQVASAEIQETTPGLPPLVHDNEEISLSSRKIGQGGAGKPNTQKVGMRPRDKQTGSEEKNPTYSKKGTEGNMNGWKKDAMGAPDVISLHSQLDRDAMGRPIIIDGVRRMLPKIPTAQREMPDNLEPKVLTAPGAAQSNCQLQLGPDSAPPGPPRPPRPNLELKTAEARKHSITKGTPKCFLDLRRYNERREAVLKVLKSGTPQIEEHRIVESIGGKANDHTRTRRILTRLISEKITASVGRDSFGFRLFELIRTNSGKTATFRTSGDMGSGSHAHEHPVDSGLESSVTGREVVSSTEKTHSVDISKLRGKLSKELTDVKSTAISFGGAPTTPLNVAVSAWRDVWTTNHQPALVERLHLPSSGMEALDASGAEGRVNGQPKCPEVIYEESGVMVKTGDWGVEPQVHDHQVNDGFHPVKSEVARAKGKIHSTDFFKSRGKLAQELTEIESAVISDTFTFLAPANVAVSTVREEWTINLQPDSPSKCLVEISADSSVMAGTGDLRGEPHVHLHLVKDGFHSPAIGAGREQPTSMGRSLATSKDGEVKSAVGNLGAKSDISNLTKPTDNSMGEELRAILYPRGKLAKELTGVESAAIYLGVTSTISALVNLAVSALRDEWTINRQPDLQPRCLAVISAGSCVMLGIGDLRVEPHVRDHLVNDGSHSPAVGMGREQHTSKGKSSATSKGGEVKPAVGNRGVKHICNRVEPAVDALGIDNLVKPASAEVRINGQPKCLVEISADNSVMVGSGESHIHDHLVNDGSHPFAAGGGKEQHTSEHSVELRARFLADDGERQDNNQHSSMTAHSPGWRVYKSDTAGSNHLKPSAESSDTSTELETKDWMDRGSTILGIRYKIQRATDQFLDNEWLQTTLLLLLHSLDRQSLSEHDFWSKMTMAHYPLWGNGLAAEGDGRQPSLKGDCLYTAAILATERYSQAVEFAESEAQFLKKGTIHHLKKIVRHFYGPTRTALPTEQEDSGDYLVRRATLLGQLLQTLSWDEFEQYAESMENGAPHPAGPLEICVLSHLMKKDIQVYRQVDELQDKVSNPVLAICLDTLSQAENSFKILLHEGHFTPLPEVLCPTTIHLISRNCLDIWSSGGPSESLWPRIRGLLINTSRVDHLQHDHWSVALSSATSMGSLGLRELLYLAIVSPEWKRAADQAMRLMRSLSFRASKHLKLVIPASIHRCGTGNLNRISLRGCTINTNTGFHMEATTLHLCHRCPRLTTIDLAGCSETIILPILATLAQIAFCGTQRDSLLLAPKGDSPSLPARGATTLYKALSSASSDDRPIPVGVLLETIESRTLPKVLLDKEFLPPKKALSTQARVSGAQVALLLGVVWGIHTNGTKSRVFSAVTGRIDNRLPLIAAVLQGDVDLTEALLLANARINQCTEDGTTPLLQAATQARRDILELLITYNADINVTKHDSMGLLACAIQTQNSAVMQLAIEHMDPQLFAQDSSHTDTIRNRSTMLQIDDPSDLTQCIIEHCLLPRFLGTWILTHESALEQVLGVLGTILTIVLPSSVLYGQIRSLRNCVLLNREFFDFKEFTHLTEHGGPLDLMGQLAAQEGFKKSAGDRSTRSTTIVPRHANETRLETISSVGSTDNRPMLVDRTTDRGCSGHLVAWRDPAGIVVLDARSGQICRRMGIKTPEEWLPHGLPRGRRPVLAFAHMNAGDRRLIVAADGHSEDIQVYDWLPRDQAPDFSEGLLVNTLRGHHLPVTAIAVSGNNALLVSGSLDCRIIIWSIPFQELTESSYPYSRAMAFPRDRRNAPVNQRQWRRQGILTGHPQGIETIAITFDGTRVASGGEDGSIRIWDTNSLSCKGVISGSNPTGIFEWVTCPKTNRTLPKEILLSDGIDSLAISRNGSRIAAVLSKHERIADQDFQVSVWLLRDDGQPASYVALKGHTDRVTAVCFHPVDETNVVSASLDQTLRIWDSTTRICLARIYTQEAITQVAYALDGEAIVGYSKHGTMVYTFKTPKLPHRLHRPFHCMTGVTLLHFSPSGDLVASTGRDCIHIWDLYTCNCVQSLLTTAKNDKLVNGKGWAPKVVDFSAHERLIAAGGERGLVMVWDLNREGAPVSWLPSVMEIEAGHTYKTPVWQGISGDPRSVISTVVFSPDGNTLVTGENNGYQDDLTIRLWDVHRGMPLHIFNTLHTDLPSGIFHLSFPTQTQIILWTGEPSSDPPGIQHPTRHSTWGWIALDNMTPRWVRILDGHSPSVVPLADSVRVRTKDHLLIIDKAAKPIAFYNNMALITAVRRQGPNIVIGDRDGGVTFLLLQEEPDNSPLSPNEWPFIQVRVRAPSYSQAPRQSASRALGNPSCSRIGTEFSLTTRVNTTVRDFRFAIQAHLGLSPENSHYWRLLHGNRTMVEHSKLSGHRVINGSTVEVGIRLRGGMQSNVKQGQKKMAPKQNSNLSLFVSTSKQLTEREASRKREQLTAEAGTAMRGLDLDRRSQLLQEEGTRNVLAAQTRLRQEDSRLQSAKLLQAEIEETLSPMEGMGMEGRQDYNQSVHVAGEILRSQPGGPKEHRATSFVRWMMAKTMERCETGQALSIKLIQDYLRQPGNRKSVWLLLRSRMENYTGRETPGRCPTNIEVQTSFNSLADSANVSTLPIDDIDKFRQGTDFQVTLSEARHGLTEQVALSKFLINNWSFDISIDPPGVARLWLVPTNQEHNQTKLHSWIACIRASSQQQGCLDTRIEHALLAGILPSWNQELSQFTNNLLGLRLEPSRFIMTKAGRTRIKPSTAHLGIKGSQAPQFFIYIGIDRLSTQQGSLADITRDILNKKVTLQMNMVADRDKSANNIITFSIRPQDNRPATGLDEARGRAKDRLRQERQFLEDEMRKIGEISTSLAHEREVYTSKEGADLICSICHDLTSPARSRTSQIAGGIILDFLDNKDNQPEGVADLEVLAGLEPEAHVTTKVSGFPSFKAFSSDEHKKYSAAQKMTAFLQSVRNHLHERGVWTETAEAIYDGKKGSMSDDTLLVILTASSWKACTSPPAQGEPILVSTPNSIKKRLKAVGTVPFRISDSASKPAPELTFTPLDEDETDDIIEDQTILRMLQEGDLIFVPKLPGGTAQPIQRSTPWSDIPFIAGWSSVQIKNIPNMQRQAAAPGILLDLLDRGEAKLIETSNNDISVWILTTYLDAILTLAPSTIKDLHPTQDRETNRHLLLDPIKEAISKGLLLYSSRGVWVENNPFETTTVGSHSADQATEPFSKREQAALPLAITTMIGVSKSLGQGLSDITNQILRDLVDDKLLEPLLKKGHTLLIRQGSDLKAALLQTDKIRVGFHYNSTMEVPDEDITAALEYTLQRKFPAKWGIVLLSVGDDAVYPFESADFEPQLQSPDPLHITNLGSHILSQGSWTASSLALKKFRQKRGIIQQPLSSPKGILWIYPGFQEPPNGMTYRTLPQLLGPQYGTLQFLSDLGAREDFKSSMEVLNTLRDCRQQAILSELRLATQSRPIFIPALTIRTAEGKRQAVPLTQPSSHQVQHNWLPRLDISADYAEILQAAISVTKDDPKGVAAQILENYGVLLTTFSQFERVDLSTVLSTLPKALLTEPVSLAELAGAMEEEYVISFEGDQGGGNGGPARPLQ